MTVVSTNFPDTGTRSLEIAFPPEFPIGTEWGGRFCNKFLGLFPAHGMCAGVSVLDLESFAWLWVFNPRLEVDHSISSHDTHTSTGSDSNIALASNWLNECLAKHPICHSFKEGQGKWYPTRLLDVGNHGEVSDVRLVISDTDFPTGTIPDS